MRNNENLQLIEDFYTNLFNAMKNLVIISLQNQ